MKYKIAIASTDGKLVNQHFGRADSFYIIEAESDNKTFKYFEKRKLEPFCDGGEHNDESMQKTVEVLNDCQYVLVSKVGYHAQNILERKGIEAFELPGIIEDSVQKLFDYLAIQNLFSCNKRHEI